MHQVTVIVPAFEHARFLPDAIESALGQTLPPHEVLVVDDGSTDDTPAVLSSYGERIRSLRQDNRGPAAARNAGIAAARGDLLAFLDADDVWRPQKLELQVARFAAEPDLGLVHCGIETIDGAARTLSLSVGGREGWVAADILRLDGEVITGPGSTVMVPRRVAEAVGGFDEALLPTEDWDFCYRVARRYRIGYVAAPLVLYRRHGKDDHLDISRLETSWLRALEKAFGGSNGDLQHLRRHSYGRLHRILAGCYFQAGLPRSFLRHAVASVRHDPRNLAYFASYPLRALGRAARR